MERIYKIETVYSDESIDHYALCISGAFKTGTLPYHVWRDISRFSYYSIDFNAWSMFKLVKSESVLKATAILDGAMFREVNRDQWVIFQSTNT